MRPQSRVLATISTPGPLRTDPGTKTDNRIIGNALVLRDIFMASMGCDAGGPAGHDQPQEPQGHDRVLGAERKGSSTGYAFELILEARRRGDGAELGLGLWRFYRRQQESQSYRIGFSNHGIEAGSSESPSRRV